MLLGAAILAVAALAFAGRRVFLRSGSSDATTAGPAAPAPGNAGTVPGLAAGMVESEEWPLADAPFEGPTLENTDDWQGARTLRVLSEAGDTPIEGAVVRATVGYPKEATDRVFREGRTGPDGRVTLPDPPGFAPLWRFRKAGFMTRTVDHRMLDFDIHEDAVIRLEPAPPLSGRVVLAGRGTGVAGARVVAWFSVEWHRGGIDTVQITDASGAFEIAGAPPGGWLRVGVSAPGMGSVIVRVAPSGIRRPLRIEMGRGAEVSGTVRDERGRGVPGVDVFASERGGDDPLEPAEWDLRREIRGEEVENLRVRTTTDADGRYRLRGLGAPAAWIVSARSSTGAEARSDPVELLDAAARGERDLALTATGSIVVPVPGEFRVWRDGEWGGIPDTHKPGWRPEDGGWRFERVPAGVHRVHVEPSSAVAAARDVDVRPGERTEVRFDLDPGTTLTGRVTDGGGSPLEGCFVWFHARDDRVEYSRHGYSHPDGGFALEALPRIPGTLHVTRSGFAAVDRRDVVPGSSGEVTIVLSRGATIVARWRSGVGPEHAYVSWRVADGRSGGYDTDWGRTTEDDPSSGELHLHDVPSGTPFRLCLVVREHAPLVFTDLVAPAGEPLDLGEIDFPESRTLVGVVRDARGAPLLGARVRSADCWDPVATSDAAGAFSLPLLPPGRSDILVEIDGILRAFATVDVNSPEARAEITVPDPGRLVLEVADAGGRAVVAAPLNLVPIFADGSFDWRRRVIVRTDSLGHLGATVAPGHYRLQPHPGTGRRWATPLADFVVESGATVSLDLVLE